ncbi:MAG TPA: DinB family protein [Candidatus Limnocylindrales bacterium]|nr:DinB family protein [Candidatus Limnocylindrales bacterium]
MSDRTASPLEDRLFRVARLTALARGLEARGVYNGAKYLRAAAAREAHLASEPYLPDSDDALASALESLGQALAGEGYGDGFATLLFSAARATREQAALLREEAPPIFRCRTCGTLATGSPPATCPACGAHALTFAEHLPIWFLEPMDPSDALSALESGPGAVAMLVEGHDAAVLAARPRPGEWSARDVLEHLGVAEQLLAVRARRLLAEDEPDLVAAAAWAETPTSDEAAPSGQQDAATLLAAYRSLREQTLQRLRSCDAAAWARGGWHGEWGHVTLLSQCAYFARHEASHMAQLAAAVEGRVPGQVPPLD